MDLLDLSKEKLREYIHDGDNCKLVTAFYKHASQKFGKGLVYMYLPTALESQSITSMATLSYYKNEHLPALVKANSVFQLYQDKYMIAQSLSNIHSRVNEIVVPVAVFFGAISIAHFIILIIGGDDYACLEIPQNDTLESVASCLGAMFRINGVDNNETVDATESLEAIDGAPKSIPIMGVTHKIQVVKSKNNIGGRSIITV